MQIIAVAEMGHDDFFVVPGHPWNFHVSVRFPNVAELLKWRGVDPHPHVID